MKQEGHIGLSMLLTSPIVLLLGLVGEYYLSIAFFVLVIWLSTIPDIDIVISKSIIGRYIDIKHRGFTHTVYFGLVCGLLVSPVGSVVPSSDPILSISLAFVSGVLGVVFHVLGDIMTPSGVNYDPVRMDSAYTLEWFKYNNIVANFGFLILGYLSVMSSFVIILEMALEAVILLVATYTLGTLVVITLARKINIGYSRSVIGKVNTVKYWIKKLI